MSMSKQASGKVIKMLKDAFIFEEKTLFEFQYVCYEKLPGSLNRKELKRVKMILDIIMVQTLNHANIISDLITKFHARITENF